jgi:hypothetical protein
LQFSDSAGSVGRSDGTDNGGLVLRLTSAGAVKADGGPQAPIKTSLGGIRRLLQSERRRTYAAGPIMTIEWISIGFHRRVMNSLLERQALKWQSPTRLDTVVGWIVEEDSSSMAGHEALWTSTGWLSTGT